VLRRINGLAAVAAVVLLGAVAAPASAQSYSPGSPGSGDPFFPNSGNGGYDVANYNLTLDYDQPSNSLAGHAVITATATQNLSRFNLDFEGIYKISSLTVNGAPTHLARTGEAELAVTPSAPIDDGDTFTVTVDYAGQPKALKDPDKSLEGWVPTDDGAFVVNEPVGAAGWFPVNNSLSDKATYDFTIKVASGHSAIANGDLVSHTQEGGKEVWRWHQGEPMAAYLATATNGPFETRASSAGGVNFFDAVDPDARQSLGADPDPDPDPDVAWERLGLEPDIVAFFSELYGPYAFSTAGGIVDNALQVGYALESQTKPNYDRVPSEGTVVHELAHQWFGDAVGLKVWPDMWLNEGFATFSEWMWDERHGGDTAQANFDALYATPENTVGGKDLWFPAPKGLKKPSQLFGTPVYERGAMTLQALRQKVGEDTFFTILRTWYADHKYGNATTADFIALSEQVSGQDLTTFFQVWLFTPGKPAPGSW